MLGRLTIAIYLFIQLIEKYWKQKQDLYIIVVDLEKTYDRILREIIEKILEKRGVSVTYIELIKNMYEDIKIKVNTSDGLIKVFP